MYTQDALWNTDFPGGNKVLNGYFQNKGHGQGHKVIDSGVIWKMIRNNVYYYQKIVEVVSHRNHAFFGKFKLKSPWYFRIQATTMDITLNIILITTKIQGC